MVPYMPYALPYDYNLALLLLSAFAGLTSLTACWWRWRVLSLRWQPRHH